jgi:dTMP kinase
MTNRTGEYFVTEGTDATGKTTVADLLAAMAFNEGREVIRLDEPDSPYRFIPNGDKPQPLAPITSEIRSIIKDGTLARTALTNIHLFTASRAESWETVIAPALDRGAYVIAARNYLSTVAYQGYAEGMEPSKIIAITQDSLGDDYMHPDHLTILDLSDESERARRIAQRGVLDKPDTFESRDAAFQQRLIDGYRAIAAKYAITLTSAAGDKHAIAEEIWNRAQQSITARSNG